MKNIKTVGSLFFVTAFVLAVFGGASFSRAHANPIYNLYAVLMFVDAAVMLVCSDGPDSKHRFDHLRSDRSC